MADNGSKVTHRVYLEGRNPGVGFKKIGALFSHGDGKGYNLVLEARVTGSVLVCWDVNDEAGPDLKHLSQEKWKPDPNTVSHKVFAVLDKGNDKDDFWLDLGRAYPAGTQGKGFVILMDDAWPEDNKLVLREPKAEQPKGKSGGKYQRR